MRNPLFDRLADTLKEDANFFHSIPDLALERLAELDQHRPVNIVIVGDGDITDARLVMPTLATLNHYLKGHGDYLFITRDALGVDRIVRRACKANDVPMEIVSITDTDIDTRFEISKEEALTAMVDKLVSTADIVIVITRGKDPLMVKLLDEARGSGRLVTRRLVRSKK